MDMAMDMGSMRILNAILNSQLPLFKMSRATPLPDSWL